jgi:hypothetical protein
MKEKEELKKQEWDIKKSLLMVFIPIIVFIILPISYYQLNSLERANERFNKVNQQEYSGIVKKKNEEGDYSRARRWVLLEGFGSVQVNNEIYNKISKGDSVYKAKGCDSIYFIIKNEEVMIRDDNKYRRSQYLELLNKND